MKTNIDKKTSDLLKTEQYINRYLDIIIEEGLFSTKNNLRYQMNTLFEQIDLKNKKVLDIGGGSGLFSFYAASSGANRVLCLEPEGDGSSAGVRERFSKLKMTMGLTSVELKPLTIQAFEPEGEMFDIILLHNSVNHLDESACINLLRESKARDIYKELFAKVFALSSRGAKLLICDCSRYNFFALLKIRNPFVPSIGWHNHQAPETWAELLSLVGYVNPEIRWSSFNTLGNFGEKIFGNKLMSFFLTSHFCLTMDKP